MASSPFNVHQVVPDVLDVVPKDALRVAYAKAEVSRGNELAPTVVKDQPALDWEADEKSLHAVVMCDPDAPSRKDPKYGQWLHWLVVNVPGKDISKGDVLAAYVGSGPPKDSGLHRYVFTVIRQPHKVDTKDLPHMDKHTGSTRPKWNLQKWAKATLGVESLGSAVVASNFYQAQWDEYVPKLYEQLHK